MLLPLAPDSPALLPDSPILFPDGWFSPDPPPTGADPLGTGVPRLVATGDVAQVRADGAMPTLRTDADEPLTSA